MVSWLFLEPKKQLLSTTRRLKDRLLDGLRFGEELIRNSKMIRTIRDVEEGRRELLRELLV